MSERRPTLPPSEDAIEALLQDTLNATSASAKSASRRQDRASSIGLRIVAPAGGDALEVADQPAVLEAKPHGRAAWRQRLIEAERGLSHAIRSESTLLGYVVAIAVTSLAAGVLQVPVLQLLAIGFLAIQAVLVELIRIAIREMTHPTHKAAHVAAAASIMAASIAIGASTVILGMRLAASF